MLKIATAIAALTIAGCATSSKDISAAYVSPVQYAGLDCQQISSELARVSGRATELGARLDQAASNDKTIATAGGILFWPALFALGGTKPQEAEYSKLRGEYDALIQSANLKKCPGTLPGA